MAKAPSRHTSARGATWMRSASTAFPARISCTKSRATDSSTMSAMMAKLATSPVPADSALASRKIGTSGLANRLPSRF